MRLERLEISGFKSFSDRAELAFDRGVTAIVGPNGCGKSNVADAITWVLGEQSAKSLRGDKMEDVIFSGSDARKPGATAEVRLKLSGLTVPRRQPGDLPFETLDRVPRLGDPLAASMSELNGHGREPAEQVRDAALVAAIEEFARDVEVTRRLYRSGESEYLIDGEVCRLKDVHELLMDTGLGAKAYAIIEQGKIGMILSSRPTDRRQLIEEAAGITKYKSRRRAAELKLEAAQQNLTRVDDIVFEVEKQRGALKRQAAKARRYKRLRDELRRWEKVLFASRYGELAQSIEAARARLSQTREREAASAAQLAAVETDLGRLRVEQAEADQRAAQARETAHGAELGINRRQQQLEFDRHQTASLATRAQEIDDEIRTLESRREPARIALEARRVAGADAERARADAESVQLAASEDLGRAQQDIEALESAVEKARSEVYGVLNAVTALRHAAQHATTQHERVAEVLGKLAVEEDDWRRETEKVAAERAAAAEARAHAQETLDAVRAQRTSRETDLAAARLEHEALRRDVRQREQELAAAEARLASLEEVALSRAEFGDAARMVLVHADEQVNQQGAVADYLDVDPRYERAVEACLGELLQHVVVERRDQASAGLSLIREQGAGRCGFVIVGETGAGLPATSDDPAPAGVVALSSVLRVNGPYAAAIRQLLPRAYVADSFGGAADCAGRTGATVATIEGDVFRGPSVVSGGARVESRGILATRREIKELQERVATDRTALDALAGRVGGIETLMTDAGHAIGTLQQEQHRLEIAIVGSQAQLTRASEEESRLSRKADVMALERRRAEEEQSALDARRSEAESSIREMSSSQRVAEDQLADLQRRLGEAREAVAALGTRASEARAAHAALVERTAALAVEVERLEEGARELEERIAARTQEREDARTRRESLIARIAETERALDDEVRALEALRQRVREADEQASTIRTATDSQDVLIRTARAALDAVRAEVSGLEVARATAESDLSHLAQLCVESVQAPLDEVIAEVQQMEAAGEAVPDAIAITADEPDPDAEDVPAEAAVVSVDAAGGPPAPASMTAEEAIAALKEKIDRLGPVNMMAIEQFDELETRHAFLTTQRQDLIASIAQTSEAIKRIDETSKARFTEAFAAIQVNFQQTFSTLFGGGRAGLTLLDENDPLESGIDIVASPPGKRLQSVQLLSGGEKALTAIALMFAIFRYKPSPFCLLDEIDAPLDDANVGRFVEMLRGMLDRTQFILITHNRRTMEIANRLYGVTMEEPGVSKLISVALN
jgi:chromosome segregation protein